MPTVWLALKKSLQCKSQPSDVHDPRKPVKCGCSRSISNLRDVIHGSKRHSIEKQPICSPRSIGSSEFLNPITHEVALNNSTCELKITGFDANREGKGNSTFVGTLKPGTPGPGGYHYTPRRSSTLPRGGSVLGVSSKCRGSLEIVQMESDGCSSLICQKCGEKFKRLDAVELHHLSKHAVTELGEGDSSRKIVEMICHTSWFKFERVLKVHNMPKTLAQFEEYRDMVKIKASKLPKKHPRCLADGNELLRFYGTTVACFLGINASSSLCNSDDCGVCQILKHGFSTRKEESGGVLGVFTCSTSGRAFESIEMCKDKQGLRKALIVCRVIAGRVHRALENFQEMADQSGFESLAGKVGHKSNTEELYVLNPNALLPCFVVICKP